MKIRFEIRTSRKLTGNEMVPLYVRMVDGRAFHQAVRTRTLVNPNIWDAGNERIKIRAACPPEERLRIEGFINSLKGFLFEIYNEDSLKGKTERPNWLANAVENFYIKTGAVKPKRYMPKVQFDDLFDQFLESRQLCTGRKHHYTVLRRMIHRYESYVKYSRGKSRYVFNVNQVDTEMLEDIYDYMENEFEYVKRFPMILQDHPEGREIKPRGKNYMSCVFKELRAFFNWAYKTKVIDTLPFKGFEMPSERYGTPVYLTLDDVKKIYSTNLSAYPELMIQRDIFVFHCNVGCRVGDLMRLTKQDVINGALEYIPNKTINESARTVVVPLNRIAQEIVDRYSDLPGKRLLPFERLEKYNNSIKSILELAGITYLVTELDSLTRKEKKIPINKAASSHMARRTFIGNIYKFVKDPNLVSSLTGHVEGSRAFTRYRAIDIEIKKELVKILEHDSFQ